MPTEAKNNSPPKARLAFRVGIVGHRPNRLKQDDIPGLNSRLMEVLSTVKIAVEDFSVSHPDLYAAETPCLRAISPLAEGTDRHFARAALNLGYELCCPLPFLKDEYENDFKPANSLEIGMDSVAEFNSLLRQAQEKFRLVVFEMEGNRATGAEAYAAAGRVVLNQSDLLVVVWDGGDANQRGGTYETLKDALGFHVPVFWIDARTPHSCQLLLKESELPKFAGERCAPTPTPLSSTTMQELRSTVFGILSPPIFLPHEAGDVQLQPKLDLRTEYFAETKPGWNRFFGWKLFRHLTDATNIKELLYKPIHRLNVPDFEAAVAEDWPTTTPGVAGWVNTRLIRHYAWSDKLADFYADKYRSSFVACYFLGALAVMLALIPLLVGLHHSETSIWPMVCSFLELLTVSAILFRVGWGKAKRWHDRWMEYRLVAELIRQLRFLIPLGGGRPFPRLPQHLETYGNPADSWMYWHLRAIDRDVGLPNARMDSNYLRDSITYISKVVQGQIQFHRFAAERNDRIEQRLHRSGLFLFGFLMLLIVGHILVHLLPHHYESTGGGEGWDVWSFLGAFLPAVGAALAAINNQGEFGRIAKRSRAMAAKLEKKNKKFDEFLNSPLVAPSSEVANLALQVAQTMVDEVLDWRVVFLDRPLTTSA